MLLSNPLKTFIVLFKNKQYQYVFKMLFFLLYVDIALHKLWRLTYMEGNVPNRNEIIYFILWPYHSILNLVYALRSCNVALWSS